MEINAKINNSETLIIDLQFEDTWYKKEGIIDKSILKDNHTIEGLLTLDYPFNGLVFFQGKITV